jgi:hypothetical protein
MFMWSLSVGGKVGIDTGSRTASVSSWSCRGRLSRQLDQGVGHWQQIEREGEPV